MSGEADQRVLRMLTNLVSAQYTGYAIVSKRSVGDQPGRDYPRYLTEWKRLPDRVLIAPYKFGGRDESATGVGAEYKLGFSVSSNGSLPFPRNQVFRAGYPLPYIAFDPQGQLIAYTPQGQIAPRRDELIALAEGSVFFPKRGDRPVPGTPDVDIRPPMNYTNNFIRINWLTGRASVDEATRPKFRD
jgi:hypothetical protein